MIQSHFNLLNSDSPIVATAIHNGHLLPDGLKTYTAIDEDSRYREEDPFTGIIASQFPNHFIVDCSRFTVDLNRSREKCVYQKPEDAWGLTTRTPDFPPALAEELKVTYDYWYSLMDYHIQKLLEKHQFIVVFDIHSYNHRRGGPDAEKDPQIQNPDIILGRSNMAEKYYDSVEDLAIRLRTIQLESGSLDARCDIKFPGGNFPRYLNKTYAGRLICIAVEFKKIFIDEWTGVLDPVVFRDIYTPFYEHAMAWAEDFLEKREHL